MVHCSGGPSEYSWKGYMVLKSLCLLFQGRFHSLHWRENSSFHDSSIAYIRWDGTVSIGRAAVENHWNTYLYYVCLRVVIAMYVLIWRHNSSWLCILWQLFHRSLDLEWSQLNPRYQNLSQIQFRYSNTRLCFSGSNPVQETSVCTLYVLVLVLRRKSDTAQYPCILRGFGTLPVSHHSDIHMLRFHIEKLSSEWLGHSMYLYYYVHNATESKYHWTETIHQSWSIHGNIARSMRLPSNPIELFDIIIYPRPWDAFCTRTSTLHSVCIL